MPTPYDKDGSTEVVYINASMASNGTEQLPYWIVYDNQVFTFCPIYKTDIGRIKIKVNVTDESTYPRNYTNTYYFYVTVIDTGTIWDPLIPKPNITINSTVVNVTN